jgi:hypothetical protein
MRALPLLFAVFWTSVLTWSLLAGRLAEGLRRRHPLVYDTLGPPVVAGPLGRELALLRFLLAGRYQVLDDPALVRLSGVLRTFLVAYAAFFAVAPVALLK